jgi:hypothetical protein
MPRGQQTARLGWRKSCGGPHSQLAPPSRRRKRTRRRAQYPLQDRPRNGGQLPMLHRVFLPARGENDGVPGIDKRALTDPYHLGHLSDEFVSGDAQDSITPL